jgi:outer membrane receptor protein involved in Fe transport
MRRVFITVVAVFASCLVLSALDARAQETINSASVSGRVTDPQGGVVPGAQVVARQTETNVAAEATTDSEGRFRFPYLRVGPYEITVRLQGFADGMRRVTATVGGAYDLPITLNVGGLDTSVTVSGQAEILETARSQIAGTVSQAEVKSLPMNGRNFLDLALLVPGVSPTNTASTQLFAETSAVQGQGMSVGSQRNFSNNFIVDGLSANDDAAGLSGIPYGVDAVDQFQVVTAGGQAELGRALGGYVNIVTKSGTNVAHADVYGYFRDDRLNAANPLLGSALPMDQKQYGGSFGGPIERDRTFVFGNVEQRTLSQSGLVTIPDATVATINARLAAVGYPGSPIATGVYANPVDSTNVLVKMDHQASSRDQLSVRYAQYNVTSSNSRGAGGISASSASAALDNVDRTIAFSNTVSLSSRTVNETRAQFAYSSLAAPPTDPVGPAVSISGIASFGTLSGSPTGRLNKLFEVVDNLSHQAGAHALRAGVDVLYNDDLITFPRSNRGAYTFSSLATFLAGVYNNAGFAQTFGATQIAQTNPNLGVYAQDEWKAGPRLTLNLGVRYDLQWLKTIATDTNNVSPRAGFAWTPSDSSHYLIRGSAGLFYDRVPLRAVANALLSAGNTTDLTQLAQTNVGLSPTQAGAPVFPNTLSAVVPLVTLVNFSTMDPNMQNAYSRQVGIEFERELAFGARASVGYQYTAGRDLIVSVNQNVPTCVAAGTNNGCRPNPSFANNSQYSPLAESAYHGVHVSFVQRPTRWGSYRVSYTLSNRPISRRTGAARTTTSAIVSSSTAPSTRRRGPPRPGGSG